MNVEQLPPADRIALFMGRVYADGLTTSSGGNLSLLDASGDLWITPRAVDKGRLTPADIVQVKPDGRVVGRHPPSVELPFHQLAYRARPDFRAIVHAHPAALVAFSMVRRLPDERLVPDGPSICGDVGMAEYGLPGSLELGQRIAAVFARGCDTVVLENHGVVAGAASLARAFMAFETLDHLARLEIAARRIGTPRGPPPVPDLRRTTAARPAPGEPVPADRRGEDGPARQELCDLVHRACDQALFTSTQGTFSRRLGGTAFLITPTGIDRRYLEPADVVRVEGGRWAADQAPSRSVHLHDQIYRQHPHVGAVILGRPPSVMAFAVTGQRFDTRTIPESYVVLREVARLPFGTPYQDPGKVAAALTRAAPVALVENDCLLVTAPGPLAAFDRLEVAEYTARALVACRSVGPVVMIDDAQAAEIDRAFPPQ